MSHIFNPINMLNDQYKIFFLETSNMKCFNICYCYCNKSQLVLLYFEIIHRKLRSSFVYIILRIIQGGRGQWILNYSCNHSFTTTFWLAQKLWVLLLNFDWFNQFSNNNFNDISLILFIIIGDVHQFILSLDNQGQGNEQ